jgi:fructosamine-3-kinase
MNTKVEKELKEFFLQKKIIKREILSNSFNMICEKIYLDTNEIFVAKYYQSKNNNFNSIISEANSLTFLSKKFCKLFPSIKYKSSELLLISFIKHNNIKHNNYQNILADEILKIHKITNDKYGFDFDAQIGGLKQTNSYESNWVKFYKEQRLGMIYEKINQQKPMPKFINQKIDDLLKNLENYLPKNPSINLLHGDLWSGNILFNNGKLASLIDPGIYYGHNELEIAYLTWFKYVDNNFLNYYSEFLKIDKYYYKYEPIYQLYFSLLNIYLWSREYIKDTDQLLKKIT